MAVSSFPQGALAYSKPRIKLRGATLSDTSTTPTDASVGYQVANGGAGNHFEQSYTGSGNPYTNIGIWLLPKSVDPADYDVRLTVNSGTTPAGSATGTWLSLSASRAWTLTDTGPVGPAITNNCTVEIRDATSLVVLDSATVTMSVQETA